MKSITKCTLIIIIHLKSGGIMDQIYWEKDFSTDDCQIVTFTVPGDWRETMKDSGRRVQMLTECLRSMHPLKDDEELNSDIAELIKDVSIDPDIAARIEELDYDNIRFIDLEWQGDFDYFYPSIPIYGCRLNVDTGEINNGTGCIICEPQSPLKAEVF